MVSSQVEFLPNRYLGSVSLKSRDQVWNGESLLVLSNAVVDPSWWTENINPEIYCDEVVVNSVPQESRLVPVGVSIETSRSKVAGTSSMEGPFQPIGEPFEFSQVPLGVSVPASLDIDFETEASSAYSDGSDCKSLRSSSPSMTSQNFASDLHDNYGRRLVLRSNQTSSHESHDKTKRQIPKLDPFACPHCCQIKYSKRQLT